MVEDLKHTRRKYLYVMDERRFLEGTRGSRQQVRIMRGRIEAMLLQELLEDVEVEDVKLDHANGADGSGNRLVATSITGEGYNEIASIGEELELPFSLS